MMIRIITLFTLSLLIFSSCTKENEDYFDDSNGLPTIELDSLKYSYISQNDEYFYESVFKGKTNIQKFNLKLKKNRKYRISCSQNFSDSSTINLSLLSGQDTITLSKKINGTDVLYFNSSQHQKLVLQAQLQNEYNISLDYRLYFEELEYDTLQLNNKPFTYNGHFTNERTDTAYFYPSESYWYRWMKYNENISNTATISYSFKSDIENQNQEFGFVIAGKDYLSAEGKYQDNLPNGIFFSVQNNQFTISKIDDSNANLLENGNLNFTIDYNNSINIEIKTDASYTNKKSIFINNQLIAFIDSPTQNYLYLVFSDRAITPLQIFDFKTIN